MERKWGAHVEESAIAQKSVDSSTRLSRAGRVEKRSGHGQAAPLATLLGDTAGRSCCELLVGARAGRERPRLWPLRVVAEKSEAAVAAPMLNRDASPYNVMLG